MDLPMVQMTDDCFSMEFLVGEKGEIQFKPRGLSVVQARRTTKRHRYPGLSALRGRYVRSKKALTIEVN